MGGVSFGYLRLREAFDGVDLGKPVDVQISYRAKSQNPKYKNSIIVYPISDNREYFDINGNYWGVVWTIGVRVESSDLADLNYIIDRIKRYFNSAMGFVVSIDTDNATTLTDIQEVDFISVYLAKVVLDDDEYSTLSVGDTVKFTKNDRDIYGQIKYKNDDEVAIYVFLKPIEIYDILPIRQTPIGEGSIYLYMMNVDIRLMAIEDIGFGGV